MLALGPAIQSYLKPQHSTSSEDTTQFDTTINDPESGASAATQDYLNSYMLGLTPLTHPTAQRTDTSTVVSGDTRRETPLEQLKNLYPNLSDQQIRDSYDPEALRLLELKPEVAPKKGLNIFGRKESKIEDSRLVIEINDSETKENTV